MKKIVTIFLLAALVLSVIPFGTFAVEETENLPFIDVKIDDWFYDAVSYSCENGIFKGTNEEGTEFSPNRTMTRAEFATTLFRVAGMDEADFSGDTGFSDVAAGSWMSAPVKWAAEKGYVKGTGSDKFDPNGTLDRQQLATMLYRFSLNSFGESDVDEKALEKFADGSSVASWALEAMTWANSVGIINGNEKGLLVPSMSATRAQVAQILMNFEGLYTGTDADGVLNKDIVLSVNNAKHTEAKNIIFMIGDGMGYGIIELTEQIYKDQLYNGKLAMNYIAQQSCQTTYSQSNNVTDSAAGGTALATGFKTENDVVGQSPDGSIEYMNVLELAASKGKSTGVIATKSVTDATPASFTAHTETRQNHGQIAQQQMQLLKSGDLDLLMGSGIKYYRASDTTKAMLEQGKEEGWFNYSEVWNDAVTKDLPILGLFDIDMEMDTFNEDNPTVSEMTGYALEHLSKDENGFFLMVEGSQIDTYGHANDLESETHECYEFDRAVALVLEFIAENPDTVLIISADHETGGLIRPAELTDENVDFSYYSFGSHSSRNVPVYAVGYGVEALDRVNENVDIPIFIAGLLGEENFGQKSENYKIIDKTDETDKADILAQNTIGEATENGIALTFDGTNTEFIIPAATFNIEKGDIMNSRVVHIEVTNTGDTYLLAPGLYLMDEGIDPHLEYIHAGETVILSYILTPRMWDDGDFDSIEDMTLYYPFPYYDDDPIIAEMVIGDIYVTDRGLAN